MEGLQVAERNGQTLGNSHRYRITDIRERTNRAPHRLGPMLAPLAVPRVWYDARIVRILQLQYPSCKPLFHIWLAAQLISIVWATV